MNIGFIGLGNAGAKLAGSLLRNGHALTVFDLDASRMAAFAARGARRAAHPADLAELSDIVVTCLPSPAACAEVMEGANGVLAGIRPGSIWAEMSTNDASEVKRLAARVAEKGAETIECPVSGGCHRAATGNISIFAGAERHTFERMLPVLQSLGRRILHTGPIGTASTLKVMTNYLATANLLTLCEALVTMKAAGLDLATTYEAIRISSGTSFVAETEGQVILNGSRDIEFTMDLVLKDIGLFQDIADEHGVPLDISPLMIALFRDGQARYGERANSDDIIRRLEEATGLDVTCAGFPALLLDDEPEAPGYEVVARTQSHS